VNQNVITRRRRGEVIVTLIGKAFLETLIMARLSDGQLSEPWIVLQCR
jgi:hypothetical protein